MLAIVFFRASQSKRTLNSSVLGKTRSQHAETALDGLFGADPGAELMAAEIRAGVEGAADRRRSAQPRRDAPGPGGVVPELLDGTGAGADRGQRDPLRTLRYGGDCTSDDSVVLAHHPVRRPAAGRAPRVCGAFDPSLDRAEGAVCGCLISSLHLGFVCARD